VAKSLKETLFPILFLVVGAFWLGIVATGGALLLLLAALAFLVSGVLLLATPSNWIRRPLAGASALFGLTLTIYQAYEAATLFGSSLGAVGLASFGIFGVFAVVCAYLEFETISMGRPAEAPKKA
jgi:hypothetical protein